MGTWLALSLWDRCRWLHLAIATLLLSIVALGSYLIVIGSSSSRASGHHFEQELYVMRQIVPSLRTRFQAGDSGIDHEGIDHRGPLLEIMFERMPTRITTYVPNSAAQAQALARLTTATRLYKEQIGTGWMKARKSRDPADARALVPLMDQLSICIDDLEQILKGR